jgi:hypothetical protein
MSIDRSTVIDITRTTLAVLFIGILIAACFWIMRPFLLPLVWAAMIVISTWPLMLGVQVRLWGSGDSPWRSRPGDADDLSSVHPGHRHRPKRRQDHRMGQVLGTALWAAAGWLGRFLLSADG